MKQSPSSVSDSRTTTIVKVKPEGGLDSMLA